MKQLTKRTIIGFASIPLATLLSISYAMPVYASFQGELGNFISIDNPLAQIDSTPTSMPAINDSSINESHKQIAQDRLQQANWDINTIEFLSEIPLPTEALVGNTIDGEYAHYKAIQKASTTANLAGYKQYQKNLRDLTAQAPGKRINGFGVTYHFHFIFDETQPNTLVAAYIQPSIASEYGIDTLLPITSTSAGVDNAIKTFLKTNQATAADKIAALDFPMGLRSSNANYNQLLINKFRGFGWKDIPSTIYQNASTLALTERESNIGYFYFSSAETLKGLKASSAANLLPQSIATKQMLSQYKAFPKWDVGWRSEAQAKEAETTLNNSSYYMSSLSEFYFTEKKYKLNNTQSFYIDFVADFDTIQTNDEKNPTKTTIAYAFLVVKPAKKNAAGKLDRFIYAPNTKLSTIQSDMKLYFAGKTPKYNIK